MGIFLASLTALGVGCTGAGDDLAVQAQNQAAHAALRINEVGYAPSAERPYRYIEIYNGSTEALAIAGLRLFSRTAAIDTATPAVDLQVPAGAPPPPSTLPEWPSPLPSDPAVDVIVVRTAGVLSTSDFLPGGGYALVVDGNAPWALDGVDPEVPVYTVADGVLGRGDSGELDHRPGDELVLTMGNGTPIDAMPLGIATAPGVAIERRSPQIDARAAHALWLLPGGSPGRRNHLAPSNNWGVHFAQPSDDAASAESPMISALVQFIARARRDLDCAIYQLEHPAVLYALASAAYRGVRVTLITDNKYIDHDDYRDGYAYLVQQGVIVQADDRTADQHNKFLVADGRWVWLGSFNPTTHPSSDAAVSFESPGIAAELSAEVREMAAGIFGKNKRPTEQHDHVVDGVGTSIYLSPTDDIESALQVEIARARRSIHFLAFSFSLDSLGAIMEGRALDGVEVRGVFDGRMVEQDASQWHRFVARGLDMRATSPGTMMHHKIMILDGGTAAARVVMGSYNFSTNAERSNDESLLVIRDPLIVAQFEGLFASTYASATWRTANEESSPAAGLRISEVSPGAFPWVELVNDGSVTVSTAGMTLFTHTDPVAVTTASLPPGERMVVLLGHEQMPSSSAPVWTSYSAAPIGGLIGIEPVLLLSAQGAALDGMTLSTPPDLDPSPGPPPSWQRRDGLRWTLDSATPGY